MTDKDRLIELLKGNLPYHTNEVAFLQDEHIGALADYLIANGVTVGDANNATTTWRPASEPPKENGSYLVLQKGDYGHIWHNVCKFATNLEEVDNIDFHFSATKRAGWYGYNNEWGYYEIDDITLWMPLPQPPKEVE